MFRNRIAMCVVLIFMLHSPVFSAIIFEEDFDSTTTWNSSNEYPSNECSVGDCVGEFPVGGADWNFYRSVRGHDSLSAPASIRQLPSSQDDHTTGSTAGKAFVGWDQAVDGANFPGDGILGAYFGSSANYSELYIRYYIKTESGFQLSSSAQSKLFRIGHWRGTDNIFQWADECTPLYFLDWRNSSSSGAQYLTAYRCEQLPYNASTGRSSDYYCAASDQSIPSWMKNDIGYSMGGDSFAEVYADGDWHQVDIYLKMNDIGSANGEVSLSWDGVKMYSYSNAVWLESNATEGTGFNFFAIGGNSNNEASALGEWWYAIDDVTVSTIPIATQTHNLGSFSGTGSFALFDQ